MKIIAVVLGGGTGSRLKPLTVRRAKPAVPLAGNYRLVDIPISNCINSNIFKIYLLTQYKSASLHHHIQSTYQFDQFSKGFVQLLAAEQTIDSKKWYQGTADAVRQSLHYLAASDPDLVVILSGDQLYRIDFQQVISEHLARNADVTVCTAPVRRDEAADLGILAADDCGRVTDFLEKPGIAGLSELFSLGGLHDGKYLASMGIYVFNFAVLNDLLKENGDTDFGHHLIPKAIHTHRVYSYIFSGYWKDIGTIRSFWQASLELTRKRPLFSMYDEEAPMYTRPRFLPPSQIHGCTMEQCLISEGVVVSAAGIRGSIIGLRSIIGSGSTVTDSIIMGNDFFETKHNLSSVPLGIGTNCRIEKAIIDKNVHIGNNVVVSPSNMVERNTDLYTVKDGIIVIPKGVCLPDNTILGNHSGLGKDNDVTVC